MQTFYKKYSKYLSNTLWIFSGKIIGIGLSFISVVIVARHLGPQGFGSLAYALSAIGIVAVVGHLGLSGLVVRDLVKYPEERNTILGTVAFIKIAAMSFAYILIILIIGVLEGFHNIEFYLVAIAGSSLLLHPSDTIKFWFEACVQSKYTSSVGIISQLSATASKVFLATGGFSLIYFSVVPVLSSLVSACLLILLYNKTSAIKISQWKASASKAKELISQSWMIYFGSFFAVIYLKVDQVMLRLLADTNEVGQYAVASQISEAFYFIPTAIAISFYPRLISLQKENIFLFNLRLQQLFDGLTILSLVVVATFTLFSQHFLPIIFGAAYVGSIPVLVIHIWSGVFIFQRAIFSKWILIEGLLRFSLITQGLGALANIALNFLLIPRLGGIGAAYATLFSYAVASFLSLLFYKKTRPIFWKMTFAFLSPIRYSYKFIAG
jgi:O-antigen/teichoic acid export membrane protein